MRNGGFSFTMMVVLLWWGIWAVQCQMPAPPDGEVFVVYHEGLTPGFDMGVEDSDQQRDWLHDQGSHIRMAYPAGKRDGTIFIVSGAVAITEIVENFEGFDYLSLDLRGVHGGESITITIEDSTDNQSTPQFALNLKSDWETFTFPLAAFGAIDRRSLRNVVRFTFNGPCALTVDFRDVRYLRVAENVDAQAGYIYAGGLLAPGYQIGDTVSSGRSRILENKCDFVTVRYPTGEEWGAAFIFTLQARDFSKFKSLAIDMQGESGGEVTYIGIGDTLTPVDLYRTYVPVSLTAEWSTYNIPLHYFPLVNLKHLQVMTAILLRGNQPKSIHFRNIRFLQ